MTTLIDLEVSDSWPKEVRDYLNRNYQIFFNWESGSGVVLPQQFDAAIGGLRSTLESYLLRGWHCTRLTDREIATILAEGMSLPNREMLDNRIDVLVQDQILPTNVAQLLKDKNQSHEKNRAGMIWFCFFAPSVAGEGGISDFFRYWGGEALYNSHDRDPIIGPAIASIGTPCLVDADIPISILARNSFLDLKIIRRFLVSRGWKTAEHLDHEDRIKGPLAAEFIRRVIKFPEPDFLALTGCHSWKRSL